MYLTSDGACSLRNSQTPLPPSEIAAQDAYIAAVGNDFVNGDQTLEDLIEQLGGNPVSNPLGNAGIPTVGSPFPLVPAAIPTVAGTPVATPGAPGAGAAAGGTQQSAGSQTARLVQYISQRNRRLFGGGAGGGGVPLGVPAALEQYKRSLIGSAAGCTPPQVQPLYTTSLPVPIVLTPSPIAIPAPATVAPPPAATVAPAAPSTLQPLPTTGNVCADLALGLTSQDQVTLDQLRYCSTNGYVGGLKVPPGWVIQLQAAYRAAGKLPQIPFQASPPNTSLQGVPDGALAYFNTLFGSEEEIAGHVIGGPQIQGVSGLGDASNDFLSSPVLWGGLAAIAIAMWVYSEKKGFVR